MTEVLSYTDKDILDFVGSVQWYQGDIKFPNGLTTSSPYPCDTIFNMFGVKDEYFKGKRVLDCCCNSGYFSFKALELGAGEVVGFDNSEYWISVAEKVKTMKLINKEPHYGNKLRFYVESFKDVAWDQIGKFDVVFMNSCLYHINMDIQNILDILSEACSDKLIIFTKIFTFWSPDSSELGADWKGKYVPTYEMLDFELLRRKFNFIEHSALKKEELKEVGVGISLDERRILQQKCNKISFVASKKI